MCSGAVNVPGVCSVKRGRRMFQHQNIAPPCCCCGIVGICIWWQTSFRQTYRINKLCSSLVSERTGCERGNKTCAVLWFQETKNELGKTSPFCLCKKIKQKLTLRTTAELVRQELVSEVYHEIKNKLKGNGSLGGLLDIYTNWFFW